VKNNDEYIMPRNISKKIHFIEIDWIIYFPSRGNEGRRINKYGVAFLNRKTKETQKGKRIYLEDVISSPEIKNGYPHTIRSYFESSGKKENFSPHYLENYKAQNENDLYEWLQNRTSLFL
jgi:hypothetical protein